MISKLEITVKEYLSLKSDEYTCLDGHYYALISKNPEQDVESIRNGDSREQVFLMEQTIPISITGLNGETIPDISLTIRSATLVEEHAKNVVRLLKES